MVLPWFGIGRESKILSQVTVCNPVQREVVWELHADGIGSLETSRNLEELPMLRPGRLVVEVCIWRCVVVEWLDDLI